jgi:hypothetical protein
MQNISDDLNKMKRLFFCNLRKQGLNLLQAIDCEKKFRIGFLPQIHQSITILHVKPITVGLLHGFLKDLCTMTGRQQALSYGPKGIVRLSIVAPLMSLMIWFRSGIWQERSLVGDISADVCLHGLYW